MAQNERKEVNISEGNKLKHECFCKITGKLS